MKIPFEYIACTNLEQAIELLQAAGSVAYAGGTDVLVAIRDGVLRPRLLVDIKPIPALNEITMEEDHLRIGATVTITALGSDPLVKRAIPVLAAASGNFGCFEIRNRATIGGNIANAAPCAQTAPALFVLDALVEIQGPAGRRCVPIASFITGVSKNTLEPGELITGLLVPHQPADSVGTSVRVARVGGMDLPAVNLAVHIIHPRHPENREIRFCVGSCAKVPLRPLHLEARLRCTPLTDDLLNEVAAEMRALITPRDNSLRASPHYKRHMIGVLLSRTIHDLLGNGSHGSRRD
ncbi:xanthine dehydrogenase family protein subunit M [bacterium]|nr:xanthine dehydrogenase family protein subunit M [candidate division CSSED10-310 bacterium]